MAQEIALRGGVVLGRGMPKICVPLTGEDAPAMQRQALDALAAGADLVEFRADWPAAAQGGLAGVLPALAGVRHALPATPLLFTLRTPAEGGRYAPAAGAYAALLHEVLAAGGCDLVDIELAAGDETVRTLAQAAGAAGVVALVSSHNFAATPPAAGMLRTLLHMRALGAGLPKLAVTPARPADVLALLNAADRYATQTGGPLVAVSMGHLGGISRVGGGFFGSVLTFAAAGAPSAPGQLDARALRTMLEVLYAGEEGNASAP